MLFSKIDLLVNRQNKPSVSSNIDQGGVQHYVIKFVSDLRQVGSFLRVLRFPPQKNHYVQPCCRVDFNVYLGLCVGCNLLVLHFSPVHIIHTQSEILHRLTVIFLFLLVVHFTDLGIFNMYQFYATFR